MAVLPMALIVVLHLGLVLLWMSNARVPSIALAGQRHFVLTWLPPLKPPAPPPRARAPELPVPVSRPRATAAPRLPPVARTPVAQPPVQTDIPQESSAPPAIAPDAPDARQMIANARRQAGMADRELRGGKAAPLSPDANLPIARFREALEGAYIDRSRVMVTERLTQADGVVVYRYQYAGKVWCRTTGGIGPGLEPTDGAKLAGAGSRGGGGKAGNVSCPGGDAGWSRL